MAIAGRKPKPPGLRLLEGNPGHRRIKEGIKVALKAPPCPEWLSPMAKTEWKRVAPKLEKLGLLGEVDMAVLAGYCEALSTFAQCQRYLNRKGGVARYLTGKTAQASQHIAARDRAWKSIVSFCSEFGMSPSSRGRMQTPNRDDGDDEDLD